MRRVIVIGAGVGGLASACVMARRGFDVTVLEAHIYPGGCAGTFYHQGYRFDAGATLAGGFYPGGPMDMLATMAGIDHWPIQPAQPTMEVYLPGGFRMPVTGDNSRWEFRREAFGVESFPFWEWQEDTADALWELALTMPAWPPQTTRQLVGLFSTGMHWLRNDLFHRARPEFVISAFQPIRARLPKAPGTLHQYIDAQLLISAQTTSRYANSLYGAAALDLPRRGVAHVEGGIGAIAHRLVKALRTSGGTVHYRSEVTQIHCRKGQPKEVVTRKGERFLADIVIANLTPWNIQKLLEGNSPPVLSNLQSIDPHSWGAFMLYLGVDACVIKPASSLHRQVIVSEPLGEGNSIFISISPSWDSSRAPLNTHAITISTHTRLAPWWQLFKEGHQVYEAHKSEYTRRLLKAAEVAIPGITEAARLILPGTPVTFQHFTRRNSGFVGGFPQTNLFRTRGPQIAPGIFMVGDSIFPGQSIAGVALGGMRVAHSIETAL